MKRHGFTLIEVMVTLVIVAMFSTAVYAVFLRSIVDTKSVGTISVTGRLGQSVLRRMELDLMTCVAATEEVPHFVGTVETSGASGLEFISANDSRAVRDGGPTDLVTVSYLTRPNDDALEDELLKLYRKETPAGDFVPGEDEEFVLLDDQVKRFELEYFDGAAWQSVWEHAGVPRAVHVTVVFHRKIQVDVSRRAEDREFTFDAVIMIPAGG
jgi:prepilin-type N-terminal cleavage/methylation domain-containing protein